MEKPRKRSFIPRRTKATRKESTKIQINAQIDINIKNEGGGQISKDTEQYFKNKWKSVVSERVIPEIVRNNVSSPLPLELASSPPILSPAISLSASPQLSPVPRRHSRRSSMASQSSYASTVYSPIHSPSLSPQVTPNLREKRRRSRRLSKLSRGYVPPVTVAEIAKTEEKRERKRRCKRDIGYSVLFSILGIISLSLSLFLYFIVFETDKPVVRILLYLMTKYVPIPSTILFFNFSTFSNTTSVKVATHPIKISSETDFVTTI